MIVNSYFNGGLAMLFLASMAVGLEFSEFWGVVILALYVPALIIYCLIQKYDLEKFILGRVISYSLAMIMFLPGPAR